MEEISVVTHDKEYRHFKNSLEGTQQTTNSPTAATTNIEGEDLIFSVASL